MGTYNNPAKRKPVASCSQYVSVRQRLDDLGYTAYLANDAVPLVDQLLNDLLRSKEQNNLLAAKQKTNDQFQRKNSSCYQTTTDSNQDLDVPSSESNQLELSTRKSTLKTLEAIKVENLNLQEEIANLKFVLDQNSKVIQKLKKDNDAKSLLILQIQNGTTRGLPSSTQIKANIEKDADLPNSNLSKIQSLYKRILSASDNPAIVDWVKTAESKIASLERDLENTCKALQVSQQMSEDYQKQVLEYENKLTQLNKANSNRSTQNYGQMKSRLEQKEKENRELQSQLTEAVRKQHEAMSRAIMLAGDRPQSREICSKLTSTEKRVVGLETERGVLKKMLTTTQKERDELMKEVQRLHSQESTLMNEIRSLVCETNKGQESKGKTVRFQNQKKGCNSAADSGVESARSRDEESDCYPEGGTGRNREDWLKRLTEQRQLYYDNVHQLLNYMKNRQELFPHAERSSNGSNSNRSQQGGSQSSSVQSYPPPNIPSQPYQLQPHTQLPNMNQSNFYHIPPAPVSYQLPFGMQQQTNPAEAPTIQEPILQSKSTMTNQQADRDTQTDQPAKPSVFNPTSEEMGKLPSQFQTWARSLLDERKVLKEQNAELRLKSDELFERSQEIETKLAQLVENMRKTDEVNCKLRFELEQATTRANTAERDLLLERTKLQQLKLDIEDADGNAASLTKKYAEKSSQLDSARQRCAELEKNVASLENQMAGVHGQLRGLQGQRSHVEVEQQKLLDDIDTLTARIGQLDQQLTVKQDAYVKSQADLETANNKLKLAERELILERTRLQQLRIDIGNADSNVVSMNKKMMEKTVQLDSSRQRCAELELQVSNLNDEIGGLQGQLRNLQIYRSQSETEQRQLLDQVDASNVRISQLEKQLSIKQEIVTQLQASVKTYETKIRLLEQDDGDKQSQVELNRRQNHRLMTDLDQAKIDNNSLRQENERLVSSLAMTRLDLERERQAAEDLRREMQSYISHVRQVETVLARKDEERDTMLKQFQQLANESSSFDAEREQMERTLRGQQQQTTSLQNELTSVRRRLGELEQLYSQQRSAGAEAQLQGDDLLRRLQQMERDLREARDDKMRLEQQLAAANDLQQRLEKQIERLRIEAAQADSASHQMEAESTRLHDDLHIMEQRLAKEKESVRSLESLVTLLRQERSQQESQLRSMSQDLTRLQQREILLQEELANVKAELCANEGKNCDLSRENQRMKQEILQERFEREKTRQEYKRMGNLSQTPIPFTASPSPVGLSRNLPIGLVNGCVATANTESTASSTTNKRVTVASRFSNHSTQT